MSNNICNICKKSIENKEDKIIIYELFHLSCIFDHFHKEYDKYLINKNYGCPCCIKNNEYNKTLTKRIETIEAQLSKK